MITAMKFHALFPVLASFPRVSLETAQITGNTNKRAAPLQRCRKAKTYRETLDRLRETSVLNMTTRVMYGRREGKPRGTDNVLLSGPQVGFAAQGIDPKNVLVVQPKDWKRIQDNLSRYNKEAEEAKLKRAERERLHETSKHMVKSWENTNEGIRQKKLEARNLREQKEEEERVKIDIEEAKFQAQKRKEAIERAKTLQYYQTDRVKEFHGAMLLTEVMKERDAQVELKKQKANWEKEKDEHFHKLHQRQIEESTKQHHEKALERFNNNRSYAQFQLKQVSDNVEVKLAEKEQDRKEGQEIKEQVEIYEAAKAAVLKQKRADKLALLEANKKDQELKKLHQAQVQEKEVEEDIEIGKFVQAKKKMIKMRKDKEHELFQAFQDYTERMREKLFNQMKQKVDDEDERIAKAVAEQERDRIEKEQRKSEERAKELEAIKQHRISMMKFTEVLKEEENSKDIESLKVRIAEDHEHRKSVEEKKKNNRQRSVKVQQTLKEQMHHRRVQKEGRRKEQLEHDKKNLDLVSKEEEQFQEYAKNVISEAKLKGRDPYPLVKVAASGPGGGCGPKFDGIGGLRPSYPTSDATGVQLPYYRKDGETHNKAYGHVGRSGKRLGFTW